MIGTWQLVIIFLIVIVIFGAGKLPSIAKDIAKGVNTFKGELKDEAKEGKQDKSKQNEDNRNS